MLSKIFEGFSRCGWRSQDGGGAAAVITVSRLAVRSSTTTTGTEPGSTAPRDPHSVHIASSDEQQRVEQALTRSRRRISCTLLFLSLRESATVEMRDSVQSVEFRRDERPKLLPRFLGKERPSFAKSDLGLGTWGRNSMSASLFHFEQAASGCSMSRPPGTCKYL